MTLKRSHLLQSIPKQLLLASFKAFLTSIMLIPAIVFVWVVSTTSVAAHVTNDGTFLVIHQISWRGSDQGCDFLSLGMDITCPTGAVIISDSNAYCSQVSQSHIKCTSDPGDLQVGCYGSSMDDLELEAIIPMASYYCTGEEAITPKRCSRSIIGSASIVASAFTVCENGEPGFSALSCSDSSYLAFTNDGLAYCVVSGACTSIHNCCGIFPGCSGADHCYADVGPVGFTATPHTHATNNCVRHFSREIGAPCEHDFMCTSDSCVSGICVSGLMDVSDECQKDQHCSSGACAVTYNGKLASAKTTCCPIDETVTFDEYRYCANVNTGGHCLGNEMCRSGVCVEGKCEPGLLSSKNICDDNDDCISRTCATMSPHNSTVCCPSSKTFEFDIGTYCVGQRTGGMCRVGAHCQSGFCISGFCVAGLLQAAEVCQDHSHCLSGACANKYEGSEAGSDTTCCPEDKTVLHGETEFCTVGAGDRCGSNDMCQSGVCVGGVCMDGLQKNADVCDDKDDCLSGGCASMSPDASKMICCPETKTFRYGSSTYCVGQPSGGLCMVGAHCQSGVCVSGLCAEGKLSATESCQEDSHCHSGACALTFDEKATSAHMTCCQVNVTSVFGESRYCTVDAGSQCGSNEMCQSGVCVKGTCMAGPQETEGICDDNGDCINKACAIISPHSSQRCCSSSRTFGLDGGTYCNGQPRGGPCRMNAHCTSQTCLIDKCSDKLLANFEQCGEDSDCLSKTCAFDSMAEKSVRICCADRETYGYRGRRYCMVP